MRTFWNTLITLALVCASPFIWGQSTLTLNNNVHLIQQSGTYEDWVIPSFVGSYDHIEFTLKGGDGGRRRVPNLCRKKGGEGATVVARFRIGTGAGQLQPGGTIRFIVGEKGSNQTSNAVRGAGGGGGSGILYLAPSGSHTSSNDYPARDFSLASTSWVMLAVAGGGGGAGSSGICNGSGGDGGQAGVDGSDGKGGGGSGGIDGVNGVGIAGGFSFGGSFLSGGGGSYRFSGTDGNKGGLTGGNGGNRGRANGGFGFGSGGSGDEAGGGGGGFSGGGGGGYSSTGPSSEGGGGGGSFINSVQTHSSATEGGTKNSPNHGYITYQFQDLASNIPVAQCKNISLQLDASGEVTLFASDLDNGSYNPLGGSLIYYVPDNMSINAVNSITLDCDDEGFYDLIIQSTTGFNRCLGYVTLEDNLLPTALCQNVTLSTDAAGRAAVIGSDLDNGSADNCGAGGLIFSADTGYFDYVFTNNSHIVTLYVSDGQDNISSCTAQVTVVDTIPPVAICQNKTLNIGFSSTSIVSTSSFFPGSYDEGGSGLTPVLGFLNFNCSDIGSFSWTFTLTDQAGNSSSCTSNITVRDNNPPFVSCPGPISVSNDPGQCGAVVSYGVSGSDNCSSVQTTQTDATGLTSGDEFPIGVTTLSYTVSDASGNTADCSFTVTVNDTELPTISCPGNITQNADPGSCTASVLYGYTTADNCPPPGPFGLGYGNQLGGGTYPTGTSTQTLTVTDASGNSASCSFDVTVIDNQPPSISCPANISAGNDPGQCDALVHYTLSSADNCSGESVSQTAGIASGSSFPIGTTVNEFTVTDASGNTASCSFSVSISDTEAPQIFCPANIQVNNDPDFCGAVVTYSVTSYDNCSGESISQTAGTESGGAFETGTTTNSFTVTDASGHTAACSFDVTVTDNTPPTLSCPNPIFQNVDPNSCGAVVNFTAPEGDDGQQMLTIFEEDFERASNRPGGVRGISSLLRSVGGGITNSCFNGNGSQWIKYNSTVERSMKLGPIDLSTGDGYQIDYLYLTTDCNGGCANLGCDLPEPNEKTHFQYSLDGTNWVSIHQVGPNGGPGNGRFQRSVELPAAALSAGTYFRWIQPQYSTNGSKDNWGLDDIIIREILKCNTTTLQTDLSGLSSGSTFPLGVSTLSYEATDASGNTSSCSFNVTVTDNQLPTISCPSSISLPNDPGQCDRLVTYLTPIGSDNCNSSTSQTAGLGSGSTFPLGTTTEAFTVTDASGNTAACSFSITISDDELPVFSLSGSNPVILCEGEAYVEAGATATDNCDAHVNQNILTDNSAVNTAVEGNYTVTYTVTDVNGNSAQATRTVIVKHTPAQLAPQNCGNCSEIRLDFCEGEAAPDLDLSLTANTNYESGVSLLWYEDDNSQLGSAISKPVPNMASNNTRFYWVSQILSGCEGEARRVRVRVRKTSIVTLDLPAIGCGAAQIDLAAYVSDSRNIASGYTFYDADPKLGTSPVGSVSASSGQVNGGQYAVVSLQSGVSTYYAVASNNTGCQVTGSDEVQAGAGATLAPISNITVNSGDLVTVHFNSPDATHIFWYNLNAAPIGLVGNFGMGDLIFTAYNPFGTAITANIRAYSYNGNCAGEYRDFTITVNPGVGSRQGRVNSLQLAASKVNAHDVRVEWEIVYEFALEAIEVEKQLNEGEWVTVDQQGVGSDYNLTLQGGTYLDRSGMGNLTRYRLKLIHADGRAIWSQEVEVNFDFYDNKRFTLYPNPSDGRFSVRSAGPIEGEWRYKLSDQLGRTILIGKLQGRETAFDISHLPTAHYFLLLTSPEGRQYLERIVKQ